MVLDGEELYRCPLRPLYENFAEYSNILGMYMWYQRGVLPDAGTFLDQTEVYLTAMRVIDVAVKDAEEMIQQKRDRQEKAKSARIGNR